MLKNGIKGWPRLTGDKAHNIRLHMLHQEKKDAATHLTTLPKGIFAIERRYTRHPKYVGTFNATKCAKHMSSTF